MVTGYQDEQQVEYLQDGIMTMNDEGSMSDDIQSLKGTKRLKIDQISYYSMDLDNAESCRNTSKSKQKSKTTAFMKNMDTTAGNNKYFEETFDSVNEWDNESN